MPRVYPQIPAFWFATCLFLLYALRAQADGPKVFYVDQGRASPGHGERCAVVDPGGLWIVPLRVMDGGTSELHKGDLLCAVVHSPAFFSMEFMAGWLPCEVLSPAPDLRYTCGWRATRDARIQLYPAEAQAFEEDARQLQADIDALRACRGRDARSTRRSAADLLDEMQSALDEGQVEFVLAQPWYLESLHEQVGRADEVKASCKYRILSRGMSASPS